MISLKRRPKLPEPSETVRRVVDALKKQRRHYAGYWEWPDTPLKEAGIMRDFLDSWEAAGFAPYASVNAMKTDPPDFVAKTATGTVVGIELTEVVCEDAFRVNINSRH